MVPDNLDAPIYTQYAAKSVQLAVPNSIDKYKTTIKEVNVWLNQVFAELLSLQHSDFPVMFHCRSGKDRTGVVIAALLIVLGFPYDLVVEEFMLSTGTKRSDIEEALSPIVKNPKFFFRTTDLVKLKNKIIG